MVDFSTEPKVTREKVFAAADQLVDSGSKPTLVNIKDILGGGSFTTISPLVAEWKESKRQAVAVVKAPLPDSVSRALSQVADQVWSAAQEEAERNVASERESLHTASAELAEREADLLDAIKSNEAEIRSLTEKLESAIQSAADFADNSAQERAALTAGIENLKLDKARLEEQGRSLETMADERKQQLAAADKEITDLQAKIEVLRTEREAIEKAASDLRHEIQSKNDEIQRLVTTVEQLKSEKDSVRKELESEKSEKKALLVQVKSEQDKNVSSAEKVAGLEKLLEQMQQQLEKERQRCDNLQSEIVAIAKEKSGGNE